MKNIFKTSLLFFVSGIMMFTVLCCKSQKRTNNVNDNPSSITFSVNGVKFVMKYVDGGTFQMGATSEQKSNAYHDESPVHSVTLSSFYMGETEVTQALWLAVMGTTVKQQRDKADPKWSLSGEGDDFPMFWVSWDECQVFLAKLNQITGENFCLPTEAEWEYAARGGRMSRGFKYAGSNSIGNVAWYGGNSDFHPHHVKTKQANELGLFDMNGNVSEWCSDWYGEYNNSSQVNPKGPNSGSMRLFRGGSWGSSYDICRVSFRDKFSSDYRSGNIGFRLCLIAQ